MTDPAPHRCRFIAGEKGRDFGVYDETAYCGAPCRRLGDGWSSYCEEHYVLCHTKRRPAEAAPRVVRPW